MAGKTDVPDSMQAGLQALIAPIANCMAAPDADMQFLTKLQQIVLLRIHQPGQKAPGSPGGAPGMGSPPAPPGAPGGSPDGAPAGMGMAGGPAGGGSPNQQMPGGGAPEAPTQPGGVSKPMTPQPDEIRRVLAEQAGQ